jgi:phytoene dehydrogenase-like protein
MDAWDVVVVGGGITGLIAAAFASRAGARVLLLEGAPDLGGRARTRNTSGYRLNQGAHAFYRSGPFDEALQDLGVEYTGNRPSLARGCFVYDNELHHACMDAEGIAATTLLSDAEKLELLSLLRRMIGGSAEVLPGTSLAETLASLSQSSKVRSVLAAMVRLTSIVNAPEVADGLSLLDQLRSGMTRRALYLDDGWVTLVDGLRSACHNHGASLRSSCRVETIEEGMPFCVKLSDGTALTARAVVLAVNPTQADAIYPPLKDLYGTADLVPAKVACLDIGVESLPRPNLLFALGVDRPLYFSVHSVAARLAPEGGALIHTMRYLRPGEKLDRDHLLAELEGFIDLVQPGWRDRERARQFLPAMPAMSSIPLVARGGLTQRPLVEVRGVPGLFVSGDWVGPAGLLSDAAAASGRHSGQAAAEFAMH